MLFIVPTPIGNLEDITLRALRILKEVDLIAAEDTRHSKILLQKYDIRTPMTSFHEHTPESKVISLIDHLKSGKTLALISDAGTPAISDPGYPLIQRAIEERIPMTVLPGPSVILPALILSGFPLHQFLYLGYLPLKKHRRKLMASLQDEKRTVVFFESPHRLLKTLEELTALMPHRPLVLCRELTKMHEEIIRGNVEETLLHFQKNSPRGEFTIVLSPAETV